MKNKIIKFLKPTAIILITGFFLFLIINWAFPIDDKVTYSTIVEAEDGSTLFGFLSPDEKWRLFTELDEISPELKKAFLAKEDRFFYYHPGVNIFAILRAAYYNIIKQKRTSGASTISMQVARMLNPAPRTYANKLIEMFRAFQLEWKYSKDEIFQLYVNLIPYGGNLEGIKAASLIYFRKNPDFLSIGQITTLVVIPNRPTSLRLGSNYANLLAARNKWLKEFDKRKLFDKELIADALVEPLEMERRPLPRIAPQFARRIKNTGQDALPIIKSSIRKDFQLKVQNLVSLYINRLKNRNINNGASIVIDNETGKVLVYVGSNDFDDNLNGGQVDGVKAYRSPGSTLKPFIYGLAIDKGLITPKSIIADVPITINGFSPENFKKQFNGNVSIEFALENSLNIPAVKVLNDIGVKTLTEKLSAMNCKWITKNKDLLGLSLSLGGCGISLEELTKAYRCLAKQGIFSEISFLKNSPADSTGIKILSKAAAFMITSTLKKITRPDLPNNFENTVNKPRIAWKTGTSYGRKDAWSIGYNKKYTVGVWVGNFDGTGVPELSGADMATPLLFEIFNAIDYRSSNSWFVEPEDLDFRLVCTESGNIPGEWCTATAMDMYIPGNSSTKRCEHMKEVLIKSDSTMSYCMYCLPTSGYIKRLFPNYSQEILSFYNEQKIQYRKIPEHNSNCDRIQSRYNPIITSPVAGMEYIVSLNSGDMLQLSCQAHNEVKEVYWYINDKFLKKAQPSENVFFEPPIGKVKISCSDDKGRNTDAIISVKY